VLSGTPASVLTSSTVRPLSMVERRMYEEEVVVEVERPTRLLERIEEWKSQGVIVT
jgi:hypothetical protein